MHAMQAIMESGSRPMQKQPFPVNAPDDRTKGTIFAQEIIALTVGQANPWTALAHRAMSMTVEARKVTVEKLDKWLRAKREETAELHDTDDKVAKQRVASATTKISEMRSIINAANGGMTYETLGQYWKCDDPQNLGFAAMLETARTLLKSNAGRKPDTLLVKLNKWIEAQKKAGTDKMTAEDRQILDDIIKVYNSHAGE